MTHLVRLWKRSEHLAHLSEGEWVPMVDDHGNVLDGIEGKRGVRAIKADGTAIGCDFIRMQPGSEFPMHTHEGDHELYFISGRGTVCVDGRDIDLAAGHVIHIPAEYPHAVAVPAHYSNPLTFAATGHPHHHVDAPDRMKSLSSR